MLGSITELLGRPLGSSVFGSGISSPSSHLSEITVVFALDAHDVATVGRNFASGSPYFEDFGGAASLIDRV